MRTHILLAVCLIGGAPLGCQQQSANPAKIERAEKPGREGAMMEADNFPRAVERAQQLSIGLKDKAKLILRKALPHIEALQRDNSHFSPRLMSLMVSRAEGKIPEADRATLGSVIQYLEEFDQPLSLWLMALKDGAHSLDVAAESAKCREAIKVLERSAAQLERMGG